MLFASEIAHTVRYLASNDAQRALAADGYWPKWDGPWWQMLTLHEMGLTAQIPRAAIEAQIAALEAIPLKIFPIQPSDMPAGIDPFRGTPCHCQLGNVYQVLSAAGVDVDARLPWIRPWFLRYQMADGGMTCDNDAYLVHGECPSSMVGTIAAFEAILLYTRRPWTADEEHFLERGASFLMERELRLGSATQHNAEERAAATAWLDVCFPRFYFYDVLRGLTALTKWGAMTGRKVPEAAMRDVKAHLAAQFADGRVRVQRQAFAGKLTLKQMPDGSWARRQEAATFPLLDVVSVVGEESPVLTREYAALR